MRRREKPGSRARVARFTGLAVAVGLLAAACDGRAPVEESADGPEPPPVETAPERTDDSPPPPPQGPEPDAEPEARDRPPALGRFGVSAGHPAAVDAGMHVLESGGNAVDAVIAAAFAVSVVEPFASGIGGGGAAVIVPSDGEPRTYDYREVVASDGRIPETNIGIPGFVAGMAALHDEGGDLPWSSLLAPAIDLAAEGHPTSGITAAQLRTAAYRLPVGELPHLFPGGAALSEGDPLVQEELASTLRALSDDGPDAFYAGSLGREVADRVEGIDTSSLGEYDVQRSSPVRGAFADYEVLAAAPPLPGVALVQMLQVAEALGIEEDTPGSAPYIHRLSTAWRIADRSVATVLGDPAFVDPPVEELTDPERNRQLAADTDAQLETAASTSAPSSAGNTTHLTVVDADGTMVSMTNTLTNFWGSGRMVAGFFLNDQLSRFSIGASEANQPEAGRRSVSWSLPAVVLDRQGRPVLGLGSPGGRRIPNILANLIVRWGLHGESLEAAVQAERFHLEGDVLHVESLPPDDVSAELRSLGYARIEVPDPVYYFGSVQALEVDHDTGQVVGFADTRREADWRAGEP